MFLLFLAVAGFLIWFCLVVGKNPVVVSLHYLLEVFCAAVGYFQGVFIEYGAIEQFFHTLKYVIRAVLSLNSPN